MYYNIRVHFENSFAVYKRVHSVLKRIYNIIIFTVSYIYIFIQTLYYYYKYR